MSITDYKILPIEIFILKYYTRFSEVVASCQTEAQLISAEKYIRIGLKIFVNPEFNQIDTIVNSFIHPKRMELGYVEK